MKIMNDRTGAIVFLTLAGVFFLLPFVYFLNAPYASVVYDSPAEHLTDAVCGGINIISVPCLVLGLILLARSRSEPQNDTSVEEGSAGAKPEHRKAEDKSRLD